MLTLQDPNIAKSQRIHSPSPTSCCTCTVYFLCRTAAGQEILPPSSSVLLSRQCATNQYLKKRDDPHRYCHGACSESTRSGPVIVPEEHLQQCRVCSETQWHCGPSGPPDGPGIPDTDFVLYVSAMTTERCSQENIVAYAAYCQLEAEMDRPIAGYANLCPNMISTQPQEFVGMLSTVKHEIIHALGFSAGLFAFYYDDDGNPLTPRYINGLPYFNERYPCLCSRWYRANYSMAERLDWGRRQGCDFAMKSCKFWIDKLKRKNQRLSPFCDTVRSNPLQLTCRQDQKAVAICNLQRFASPLPQEYQYFDDIPGVLADDLPHYGGAVEIADFCPFAQEFRWHQSGEFQRSSDCRAPENQPASSKNYGAERYGPGSACLEQRSAFVMEQCTKRMSYPDWGSGCYQVSCTEDGLQVWVHDTPYLCTKWGQILRVRVQMNAWLYDGNLVCPPCPDFCEMCPPERDPPLDNRSRAAPLDLCSHSPNLVVTLWLLTLNLLPVLAGFFLCVYN
eukprot:XP_017952801.1 PREDICTED: leishmanolysin-like peptidase [Xenopus tropicalis]